MDEAIALLRTYWSDEQIDFDGEYYSSTAMAMEPKPAQDGGPEIWIGGGSKAALRRTGQLGDGWMGSALAKEETIVASVTAIRAAAEAAGRDPASIGLQMMLQPPPSKEEDKAYYADHDQVVQRVVRLKELGFEWVSLNATAVFQAGARSVDAMIEQLGLLHAAITAETA